ncbi:MAG: Abi-alpha family protein [Alphaproteobacteria bacterium]
MLPEIKADIKAEVSAETTGKVVDFGLRVLEPLGVTADLLSRTITEFRKENVIAIAKLAVNKMKEAGAHIEPISKKFLAKFIEEASYEDDPNLQEMWANLLCSASKGHEQARYINILKEIDNTAALYLKEMYNQAQTCGFDPYEDFLDSTNQNMDAGSFSSKDNDGKEKFLVSASTGSKKGAKSLQTKKNFEVLEQLRVLGLISVKTYKALDEANKEQYIYTTYAVITLLGYKFVAACIGEVEDDNQ